jgi:serine/threonine protein kinase
MRKEKLDTMSREWVLECMALTFDASHAIKCVHANQIMWREVKGENKLVDEEKRPKLGDFGIGKACIQGIKSLYTNGRTLSTYPGDQRHRIQETHSRRLGVRSTHG